MPTEIAGTLASTPALIDSLGMHAPLLSLLLSAALSDNIALANFLGMCPLVALSRSWRVALGMGLAVTAVTTLTAPVNWAVLHYVLLPNHLGYFSLLVFIIVIAALVQILEIVLDRYSPALSSSFGLYLPLVTVNCAILGASLFMAQRGYTLRETVVYAGGTGLGWTLTILVVGALKRALVFASPPRHLGATGQTLLIMGLLALAFAAVPATSP